MGLLEEIISSGLPEVVKELETQLSDCSIQLDRLGDPLESTSARRRYYASCVKEYIDMLKNGCKGTYEAEFFKTVDNRLRTQLRDDCDEFRERIMKCGGEENFDIDLMKKLICESRGYELSIFPPYRIFESVVRDIVRQWGEPTDELFESYKKRLMKVSQRMTDDLKWKGHVKPYVVREMRKVLHQTAAEAKGMLQASLKREHRPFTMNHYLHDNLQKLRTPIGAGNNLNPRPSKSDTNEERTAKYLHNAVLAYIKVAKKRYIDNAPMILEQGLVEEFVAKMEDVLSVTDDKQLESVLAEDMIISKERKAARIRWDTLTQSVDEIKSFY